MSTPSPVRPRVEIEYCPRCRWLARAAWLAQELLSTFESELGAVALVPSSEPGVFAVRIEGETLFSRRAAGRHADAAELKRLLRDRIAPERDLGHLDRGASR